MGEPGTGNLFLVGFMGTGKSTLGRILARRMGWRFVDLDEVIVTRTGLPIGEIFQSLGEPFFRRLEHGMLEEACRADRQVIAVGGGAVCDPRNRKLMREAGMIVCLTARPETIRERLAGDGTRPLLAPRSEAAGEDPLEKLLAGRLAFYREADREVATDGLDPGAVADLIREGMDEGPPAGR